MVRGVVQIIGHRLQGNHRVDVADSDSFGDLGRGWGLVEDGPNAAFNQCVNHFLGIADGHSYDGDANVLAPDYLF